MKWRKKRDETKRCGTDWKTDSEISASGELGVSTECAATPGEQRLLDSWETVLGPTIMSYTRDLYIRNQVLYVHLTSAALRQELMMGRELLVRNLNQKVGATVITNIIFR